MKRLLRRVHPVAPDEERGHVERQIDDVVLDLNVLLVKDEGEVLPWGFCGKLAAGTRMAGIQIFNARMASGGAADRAHHASSLRADAVSDPGRQGAGGRNGRRLALLHYQEAADFGSKKAREGIKRLEAMT